MNDSVTTSLDFLKGGGEMGKLLRSRDWSQTPLGAISSWPQSLKTGLSIILNSDFPMFIWWGKEAINFYNDAYIPILGKGKHPQALGKPAKESWYEIWDIIGPLHEKVISTGNPTYFEDLLLFMDRNLPKEEAYFTFSYSPLRNDDGLIGGLFCACNETTTRVTGERQMALLRELASTPADAKTVKQAISLSFNALKSNEKDLPFCAFYKIKADDGIAELKGKTWNNTNYKTFPERINYQSNSSIWPFKEIIESNKTLVVSAKKGMDFPSGEWDDQPKDVLLIPISISSGHTAYGILLIGLNPYRHFNENYQRFVNLISGQISSNISNSLAIEEETKRAKELAELDRAKTVFFNNISHEFRTPLTLMQGPIQEMLNQSIDEEQKSLLSLVKRNGIRLQKLVNTLLDFSKVEAGRIQANFMPTDLSELTEDLSSNFRSAIEKAGIKLTVDTPKLSEQIYVDRDMWEKVVLNLLSNAFKFTFEGEIKVSLKENEKHITLIVQDSGVGIPESHLENIFERFRRIEETRSRSHEGSGIGLSLVQELVKLHSGKIEVESKENVGTTFYVTLPKGRKHLPKLKTEEGKGGLSVDADAFVQEAQQWISKKDEESKEVTDKDLLSRPLIVVVDDNADMLAYIKRLLKGQFRVETYSNGREALDHINIHHPALIVTDVMMQDMDGFELLSEIRTRSSTAETPVIMLSARAGEEAKLEGLKAGANDYLLKPFKANELITRIHRLIESKKAYAKAVNQLYSLLMQAPAILAILRGEDHVFELANEKYMEVVGKNRKILGKPALEALPEVANQGIKDLLDNVYRTGEPYFGNETPVLLDRKGDGNLEEIFINFIYQPYRNESGKILGILAHGVDVTEQVRARQKIQQNEQELTYQNSLLLAQHDVSPLGIMVLSPEGEILKFNHQVLEMWNLSPEEVKIGDNIKIIRKKAKEFLSDPSVLDKFDHLYRSKKKTHKIFHLSSNKTLECFGAPITDTEGFYYGYIWFSMDVTEREQLLKQKDEFMSIASHELKTPVTSIKGYTQILLEMFNISENPKMETILQRMDKQLDRLDTLISDLLDITRIEQGRLQFRNENVKLNEVIIDTVEEVMQISSKHQFKVELADNVIVYGDRDRIGQVVTNFLTNAVKYSPKADKIIIQSTLNQKENIVRVSVQDFGIGLSKTDTKKVFERFYRVGGSDFSTFSGIGLGLFISAEIIQRHNGKIGAESILGEGSTFYFELPVVQE